MIKTSTDDVPKSEYKIGTSYKNWFLKHFLFWAKRYQKTLSRAILIIAGVFFAVLVIEIILRLQIKEVQDLSHCQSSDKNLWVVMIPNSSCRFKTDEWDINYRINSLGLRGDEISIEKPNGVFRVLVLGDSFTQGHGVELENTYAKVLEKNLRAKSDKPIEVINAGVLGYSPLTEYLYLKEKGLLLKPDLVILAFGPTDFWDDRQRLGELKTAYPDQDDQTIEAMIKNGKVEFNFAAINTKAALRADQKIFLPKLSYSIKSWLRNSLITYKTLVDFIKRRNVPTIQQDSIFQGDIDLDILAIERGDKLSEENWKKLWELPVKHLMLIKSLLGENGVKFLVVAVPDAMQVSDLEWTYGRKVLGFGSQLTDIRRPYQEELEERLYEFNVPVLNLLPGFRESKISPLYFNYDGHWRESGHALAGELIANHLLENENAIIYSKASSFKLK